MKSQRQNNTRELLKLKDINLDYGQFRALKTINLTLHDSEIHAIVGEHGAGLIGRALAAQNDEVGHSGQRQRRGHHGGGSGERGTCVM